MDILVVIQRVNDRISLPIANSTIMKKNCSFNAQQCVNDREFSENNYFLGRNFLSILKF